MIKLKKIITGKSTLKKTVELFFDALSPQFISKVNTSPNNVAPTTTGC